MLKQLIAAGLLAGTLMTLPGMAMADHGDRRDGWDRRDDRGNWDRRDHRRNWDRRGHRREHWRWRHHNRHYWRGNWYYAPPRYRYGRHRDRGSAYLGGALIGSAITYSLLHDSGDHRYCDHGHRSRRR